MSKYFDILLKISFYNLCYPSHGNMKNNAIFGHVDLKKKSLDIIDNNIFHYLMSKNSKKIHLNIHVRKNSS